MRLFIKIQLEYKPQFFYRIISIVHYTQYHVMNQFFYWCLHTHMLFYVTCNVSMNKLFIDKPSRNTGNE